MSDDVQAPNADTPAPASPNVAPGTDQPLTPTEQQQVVDFEKRYNDLRPEYDRATQRASQIEQMVAGLRSEDPDTRRWAAEGLGVELADEDPGEPLHEDPRIAQLLAEQAEMKAWKEQQQQRDTQADEQQRIDQIDAQAQAKLAAIDGLDDEERDWVYGRALTNHPPTTDGLPDIEAAHAELVAFQQKQMQKWAASKRAPHVTPVGSSGTQQPNLDDPAERVAWMTQRLAESE